MFEGRAEGRVFLHPKDRQRKTRKLEKTQVSNQKLKKNLSFSKKTQKKLEMLNFRRLQMLQFCDIWVFLEFFFSFYWNTWVFFKFSSGILSSGSCRSQYFTKCFFDLNVETSGTTPTFTQRLSTKVAWIWNDYWTSQGASELQGHASPIPFPHPICMPGRLQPAWRSPHSDHNPPKRRIGSSLWGHVVLGYVESMPAFSTCLA